MDIPEFQFEPMTDEEFFARIPLRFWEDDRWTHKCYADLCHQYPDQWVIIYNKEVVGADRDLGKAEEQAITRLNDDLSELHPVTIYAEGGPRVY